MNFFSKDLNKKNTIFRERKEEYNSWRKELQEVNKPFFMIPSDFKHIFLKDISGGALKLFLFLGFHSKYLTGESWYSIEQVATFFRKDSRTVANWFKELEDLGLIFRGQKGIMMKANTFLKPFGFKIDEILTIEYSSVNDIVTDIQKSLDIDYIPIFGLILNHAFEEYTVVIVYQDGTEFPCSCFYSFDVNSVRELKAQLKKYNFNFEYFDIDAPLNSFPNRKQAIYNYLLKYLDEQSM